MTVSTSTRIEELWQTTSRAILNFEIWWVYKSPDTRPKYVDVMSEFQPFFVTAIHAHFVAMIVALYSLYETRPDTHNIPQLLKELESEGKLSAEELASFDQRCQTLKPNWVKVSILRNEAFGHRLSAGSIEEVFRKAQVSADDLRDLIEGTNSLMNDIGLAHDRSSHMFDHATEPTVRLLEALKRDHGAA